MRVSQITALIVCAFASGPATLAAGGGIEGDAGFAHFYNLEYDAALAVFRKRAAANPKDADAQNHVAQAILYREMFRTGALESELVTGTNPFVRRPNMEVAAGTQAEFQGCLGRSMEIAKAQLEADPRDTKALYALGVAHGLRANWNFLVRKSWSDSLRDATEARKLHNKVTEIDSTQVDARFVQALHDYIVGSLPFGYKILGFLTGFRGNKQEGIRMLEMVAEKGERNRADAAILLAAIYRREKRPREAIPLLERLIAEFPRNYLLRFELSNMYSDAGDGANAIAQLDRMAQMRRAGSWKNLAPERIDYAKGNVYFWYGELERALDHLQRASGNAAAFDLNTGTLAWMRLGQTRDLLGQREEAKTAYREAIGMSPRSDLARECKDYLSSPYKRKKKDD